MASAASALYWIMVYVSCVNVFTQENMSGKDSRTRVCRYCSLSEYCYTKGHCCVVPGSSTNKSNDIVEPRYDCVGTRLISDNCKIESDYCYPRDFESFINYAWMITKCSPGTRNATLKDLCENADMMNNIVSVLPVADSMFHYRNRYCAYCNDVKDSKKLKNWSGEIYCNADLSRSKNLVSTVQRRKCNIFFRPPNGTTIDKCTFLRDYTVYKGCSNKARASNDTYEIMEMCSIDPSLRKLTFKPYMCSTCQPKNESEFSVICKQTIYDVVYEISPPFSAILNLDAILNKTNVLKMDNCDPSTQFNDKEALICREMLCGRYRYLSNGECLLSKSTLFLNLTCYNYIFFIKLTPNRPRDNFTQQILRDKNFPTSLQLFFGSYLPIPIVKRFNIYEKINFIDNSTTIVEYLVVKILIDIKEFGFDPVEYIFKWAHHVNMTIAETVFHSELIFLYHSVNDVISDNDQLKILMPFGLPAVYMSQVDHSQSIFIRADKLECVSPFRKVDICPFLGIRIDEIPMHIENDFLYLGGNETLVFAKGEYERQNETVNLCVTDFKRYHNALFSDKNEVKYGGYNNVVPIKQLLAFFCVCLSMICLLFTLSVYLKLSELHSQPGINNITLCVFLFLAQTVYQFGAGQTSLPAWACAMIGGICHFLWLAVMFSMNVCSVEMYLVFKKLTKLPSRFALKHTMRNFSYVVASSGLFVIINIVVSLLQSQGKESGYGGSICYLSSKTMHLFTFLLPSVLLTTTNIVLFIFVVLRINKTYIRSLNFNQERNYFAIYTRLSTITGLTWAFGYLHLVLREDALEYVFIILNASQGVFIMIAFVMNKRVLSLLRKKKDDTET